MSSPGESPVSLVEAIHQVADYPCATHQERFLAAVAHTREFLFKVASTTAGENDSDGAQDRLLRVENVTAAGHRFVLAFADLDAAHRHSPNAQIASIPRDSAIRMVLADDQVDRILFTAATDNHAWAAAQTSSLERILSLPLT